MRLGFPPDPEVLRIERPGVSQPYGRFPPMDYLKLPEIFVLLLLLTPLLYALTHFLWMLSPLLAILVYLVGVLGMGVVGFRIVDRI